MNSKIFLPKKIKVGFQKRSGTYTGKLAYIIYYDSKNKLRKETSWQNWRDKDIESSEHDNEPIEGFVLNRKVGDYDSGWNHRHAYVRVYDPRGFEFEISVENLLYILDNTSAIKGKGLEGEFVYGWDGKDLVLIPTSSPDYKELSKLNEKRHNAKKFKGKDMIVGATYLTKDNKELVYMGRFECYGHNTKKAYFFYDRAGGEKQYRSDYRFQIIKTLSTEIIDCIDDKCCSDYANILDEMETYESYCPYDESKDEFIYHDIESLENHIKLYAKDHPWHVEKDWDMPISYMMKNKPRENCCDNNRYYKLEGIHDLRWWGDCIYQADFRLKDKKFHGIKITKKKVMKNDGFYSRIYETYETIREEIEYTIEEFIEKFEPMYKKEYLKNGKLRRVVCFDGK